MHQITDVDEKTRTGTCSVCGPTTVRVARRSKATGAIIWRCGTALAAKRRARPTLRGRSGGRQHRKYVGPSCERCGFHPKHPCQMDVHHKDGDHKNNDPSNLETLCANCHRLEHAPQT